MGRHRRQNHVLRRVRNLVLVIMASATTLVALPIGVWWAIVMLSKIV